MVTLIDVLERLIESASKGRLKCAGCGEPIDDRGMTIGMYLHEGGIPLKVGDGRRLWVYVECPRCGYQSSTSKLLVEVDAE